MNQIGLRPSNRTIGRAIRPFPAFVALGAATAMGHIATLVDPFGLQLGLISLAVFLVALVGHLYFIPDYPRKGSLANRAGKTLITLIAASVVGAVVGTIITVYDIVNMIAAAIP